MRDDRLNNLVLYTIYPDMVESVNLVNLCNKFTNKTKHTGIRQKLFGKFTQEDFDSFHSKADHKKIDTKLIAIPEITTIEVDNVCQKNDNVDISKKAEV